MSAAGPVTELGLPQPGDRLSAVIAVPNGGISLVCGNMRLPPPSPPAGGKGRRVGRLVLRVYFGGRNSVLLASGALGLQFCSLLIRVKSVLVTAGLWF